MLVQLHPRRLSQSTVSLLQIPRRVRGLPPSPPPPPPHSFAPLRIPQLSQEIIDQIIDNLQGQRGVLVACSSVCRAFRRRAQKNIFAQIVLFPSLETKLNDLLKHSPHLVPYVRDLVISLVIHNGPGSTDPHASLLKILPMLTHIRHLNIKMYGGVSTDWKFGFSLRLRAAFGHLFQSNTIENFILQDITNFDVLLPAKSPSLRLLVLGEGASLSPYPRQPCPSYKPPCLSVMMVGGGRNSFQSIIDCCTGTQPAFVLDTLECLGVRELPGRWSASFYELARTSLSMLKHLVIDVDSSLGQSLYQGREYIDLSLLTSLSTLELRNVSSDHNQKPFSWRCARILRTLPERSEINQVTFHCPGQQFARQMTPTPPSDWHDVDMSLTFIEPPHLIVVHFKFGQNVFPSQNPELLPITSSRGTVMRISKMIRTWSVTTIAALLFTFYSSDKHADTFYCLSQYHLFL